MNSTLSESLAILLILAGTFILSYLTFSYMSKALIISIIAAVVFFSGIAIVKIGSWAQQMMNHITGEQKQTWIRKSTPDGKIYWMPDSGIKIWRTVK